MIGATTVKICGLTRVQDAEAAADIGADYLGFIFHEKSPRNLSFEDYRRIAKKLPDTRKVAVVVEPDALTVARLAELEFDFLQVHFRTESKIHRTIAGMAPWGPGRLWFAPKMAPGTPFDEDWLKWSAAMLVDSYDPVKFGGTGRTGDWSHFRQLREAHAGKTWILSGGLTPDNVGTALAATGANFIDVNSGVEASPGLKDHAKLKALAKAIR
ncbi:MAG TPA: phosphoribosylanthranilate isomerase [Candidatus Didemnitutus sp.]|nr:phosphoribosylanthranilate isomerase [Candidatus Didemnitutus sp.]